MHTPIEAFNFDRVGLDASVATTDVNSDAVDMQNHEWVLFIVLHGTITDGTPDVKIQESNDSDGDPDDWTDVAGSLIAVADDHDDKLTLCGYARPDKQYVRCVVDRAGSTGSVVDGIVAMRGGSRVQPVTQGSTVGSSEWVVTPGEGTA